MEAKRGYMINIAGLFIIFCGFAAPFASDGQVPSTFFFWAGFLLLVWPSKYVPKESFWPKWTRIGILFNIFGTLLLLLFVYIATHPSFLNGCFSVILLRGSAMIFSPFSTIYDLFFPYDEIVTPEGTFQSISFFRASAASFGNILTHMLLGITVGKLVSAKRVNT